MLFTAMLESISGSDGSFKRMKFTWEWVVDGFLILLIICSTLLYLNYIFEGNRVWCVPSYGPLENVETFEMLFVASCCKLQLKMSILIYFPYFSAASVLLLILSHFFWKELPWIQSKIDLFGRLCIEVMSLDQVFYDRDEMNRGLLRNFNFSEKQHNLVKHIQIKMFHLLLEKSCLSKYYVFKTTFTALLCVFFVFSIAIIQRPLTFLQSTFYCEIKNDYYNKYNNQFSCDVSSVLPTYAIMFFHGLIYVAILCLTLKALWDHYLHPYPLTAVNYSELVIEFKSYPGFKDIMFMFSLIQSNVYDGGLLLSNFVKVMLLKDQETVHKTNYKPDVYSSNFITYPNSSHSSDSDDTTESTGSTVGIDVDSDEDDCIRFVGATDLRNIHLELLSKFYFDGLLQPVAVHDANCKKHFGSFSLIRCLLLVYHEIEPMFMIDDCSELVEKIQNEIIKRKEYLLLYTNCLRIKKYKIDPLPNKQWLEMIRSINQLTQFCYYVVFAAFCNIYQTSLTLITLKECENNVVEIFHPYTATTCSRNGSDSLDIISSHCRAHFYIARARNFYFVLKRTADYTKCDTIFDKTFSQYSEEEKRIMRDLLDSYKKKLKIITSRYSVKKKSVFMKRPVKNPSIFVAFDWKQIDSSD